MTQPPRGEKDGAVAVSRMGDEAFLVSAAHGGEERSLIVSEYNAWRIFGLLAVMLGVNLPKRIGKAIRLGEVSGSVEFPHDGTLGGKVASHLALKKTEEALKKRGSKGKP